MLPWLFTIFIRSILKFGEDESNINIDIKNNLY